jgi:hypothetical protein
VIADVLIRTFDIGVRFVVREFGEFNIGVNGGADGITLVHLILFKYLRDVLDLCEADGIFGACNFHAEKLSDLSEFLDGKFGVEF